MPTQPTMQRLDIFADSRDVMLRNDVLEHLQRRDAMAARTALEWLTGEYPNDGALPAMTVLVGELEPGSDAPFAAHAALVLGRRYLEDQVIPAARRVLPAPAVHAWLVPRWRSLAQRATTLTFHGAEPESHATPLWPQAGDWAAARNAVEAIESWWRLPDPLAWMTESRYRTGGLDATWTLLAELAWLAPTRFAALLPILRDATLDALRRRFDADFPGTGEVDEYAWLPACLLVSSQHSRPGFARHACSEIRRHLARRPC
jgi:hypothetical protein